jgi:hypothetical protein
MFQIFDRIKCTNRNSITQGRLFASYKSSTVFIWRCRQISAIYSFRPTRAVIIACRSIYLLVCINRHRGTEPHHPPLRHRGRGDPIEGISTHLLSLGVVLILSSLPLLSWFVTHGGESREEVCCGGRRRRRTGVAGAGDLRLLRQQAGEPAVLQRCRARPWQATGELAAGSRQSD